MSGLEGVNLIKRTNDERITSWYGEDSPCLLEILDQMRLPKRTFKKPTRVSITDYVLKQTGPLIGDCVQAKIETGVVIVGQKILLMPQNIVITVKGIVRQNENVEVETEQ